jgi:hypothetical protein
MTERPTALSARNLSETAAVGEGRTQATRGAMWLLSLTMTGCYFFQGAR